LAEDAAGHESLVAQSSPFLVDVTPPEGVACSHFSMQEEATLSVSVTSALHERHVTVMTLDDADHASVVRVEVRGEGLRHFALGLVRLQQMTMPLHFRFHPTEGRVAQHDLPDTGDLRLQVGYGVFLPY
jgi:hypothetical protein